MAPARPRGVDESRSETSSTVTNLKDRTYPGSLVLSSIVKGKRPAPGPTGGQHGSAFLAKPAINMGGLTGVFEPDPNIPRTQWHTLPHSILHAYRHAYQLDSASAYTNPHADLILTSSRTGRRSPSSVLARQKMREARRRRREAEGAASSKAKDNERSSDRLKVSNNNVQNQATTAQIENAAGRGGVRQPHSQLALSIRRHFNSQQVTEGDVIAKFVYVVRHSNAAAALGGGSGVVGMAGSKVLAIGPNEIDTGWEMASSGREEDRRRDLGFRLRFRP